LTHLKNPFFIDGGDIQRQENIEFDAREFELCQHVTNHGSNILIWISEKFILSGFLRTLSSLKINKNYLGLLNTHICDYALLYVIFYW